MTNGTGNQFVGTIFGEYITNAGIDYYILFDEDGGTSPTDLFVVEPPPPPTPTLSEWGIIFLMVVFLTVFYKRKELG